MAWVIRIVGMANGGASPHDGRLVKQCNFDTPYGMLALDTVEQLQDGALMFASSSEAFDYWRMTSRIHPLRPDGEANRPLTGLSVSVEQA